MNKGGVHFAAAQQLRRLIKDFEQRFLSQYADLPGMSNENVIDYLAESHVDFILIHPFREGNGRVSRLLLDVMAIKAGVAGEYQHMQKLVRDALEQQGESGKGNPIVTVPK